MTTDMTTALLLAQAATAPPVSGARLVVAALVTAGVLVEVGQAGWLADRLGPGLWFAVAVAVLGLLGALKAMLTVPRVRVTHRRAGRR